MQWRIARCVWWLLRDDCPCHEIWQHNTQTIRVAACLLLWPHRSISNFPRPREYFSARSCRTTIRRPCYFMITQTMQNPTVLRQSVQQLHLHLFFAPCSVLTRRTCAELSCLLRTLKFSSSLLAQFHCTLWSVRASILCLGRSSKPRQKLFAPKHFHANEGWWTKSKSPSPQCSNSKVAWTGPLISQRWQS